MRPLGRPLTLADRVRVVAALLPLIQDDIYAGKYSAEGRPNITSLQHILFDSSEDLEAYRKELERFLVVRPDADAQVCKALWPDG